MRLNAGLQGMKIPEQKNIVKISVQVFLDVHVIFTNKNDIFNLVLEFFYRLLTVFENHRKCLIASVASYIYILNGQKLIKNAKKWTIWRVFDNLKLAAKQI